MPQAPFEYRYRTALHEVDAAGVAFFGHLFRHAHDAYELFMEDLGLGLRELLEEGTRGLPLVHCEADFLAPIRHRDQVRVELRVVRLGTSSFDIGYRFLTSDGRLLARAETRHVLVDRAQGSPLPLPSDMRIPLAAYLQAPPEPA
jgi:1,4-dihydroxy-2-naphthoyl-CoA hydrolase